MRLVMVHQVVSRLYLTLMEVEESSLSLEVMVEEELLAVTAVVVVVRLEMVVGQIVEGLLKVFSWGEEVLM